jgi:hypothetical protein
MNKLQSNEIQELGFLDVEEFIGVRMSKGGPYELVVITSEANNARYVLNTLVTQKNKVRQFKTLDALDSFLMGIDVEEFTTMSEAAFDEKYVEQG